MFIFLFGPLQHKSVIITYMLWIYDNNDGIITELLGGSHDLSPGLDNRLQTSGRARRPEGHRDNQLSTKGHLPKSSIDTGGLVDSSVTVTETS